MQQWLQAQKQIYKRMAKKKKGINQSVSVATKFKPQPDWNAVVEDLCLNLEEWNLTELNQQKL